MGGMAQVYQAPVVTKGVSLDPQKRYKVFLVEIDDDDRERVVSGVVEMAEITYEQDHQTIYSDATNYPVASYMMNPRATMTLKCVPKPDGTLFSIENFAEDDEDDEV